MKIGIGITTHNRREVFNKTYEQVLKHLPEGATLVVVDDGSEEPVKEATFRFETPQGIARAKNKCFELLEGNDFIFLLDDDCYPKQHGWHQLYIEAYKRTGCNHFSLTWSKKSDGRGNGNKNIKNTKYLKVYSNPSGVMLFFTKKCLETVGGFDINFGGYGHEHVELSRRIFNAGLTPYAFCDVHVGLKYFHPLDYYGEIKSSVSNRKELIRGNDEYLKSQLNSKEFKPYK